MPIPCSVNSTFFAPAKVALSYTIKVHCNYLNTQLSSTLVCLRKLLYVCNMLFLLIPTNLFHLSVAKFFLPN